MKLDVVEHQILSDDLKTNIFEEGVFWSSNHPLACWYEVTGKLMVFERDSFWVDLSRGVFGIVFGMVVKRIWSNDLRDIFLIYLHAKYLATLSVTCVFIYLHTQPHTYLFISILYLCTYLLSPQEFRCGSCLKLVVVALWEEVQIHFPCQDKKLRGWHAQVVGEAVRCRGALMCTGEVHKTSVWLR